MENYFLGVDIGSSNIKAGAFDISGNELVIVSKPYDTKFLKNDYVQQDPMDWWYCFEDAVKEITGILNGQTCIAISISSHAPALVAVNEKAEVLFPALIWMDNRSYLQCEFLRKNHEKELKNNNPSRLLPYHFLPKLLWFKETHEDLYQKTWKFLQPKDFINYKLTKTAGTDVSMCGVNHLYRLNEARYDKNLAENLAIDLEKLPEVYESETIIGTVLPSISQNLGLNGETKVLCGGVDTAMAALGAGVYRPGDMILSLGTGANVVRCMEKQKCLMIDERLLSIPHVTDQSYLEISIITNAGNVLNWYKECFFQEEEKKAKETGKTIFEFISKEVTQSIPGCKGVVMLPYISGELAPIFNKNARGVFFGISTGTTKQDMTRAVYEGVCYSIRQNVEWLLKKEIKNNLKEIIVTGGQTKSEQWMQILADILQVQIKIYKITQTALLGNAIACIVKTQKGRGYEELMHDFTVYYPNKENKHIYDRNYAVYCQLYKNLREQFD